MEIFRACDGKLERLGEFGGACQRWDAISSTDPLHEQFVGVKTADGERIILDGFYIRDEASGDVQTLRLRDPDS
jgi:hypothetical protein